LNLGQNIVLTEIFHTFGQSGALPQIRLWMPSSTFVPTYYFGIIPLFYAI
jgi:hypothetical protein